MEEYRIEGLFNLYMYRSVSTTIEISVICY